MSTYRLVRTLPNGEQREHTDLKSKRAAASAAAHVLTDNNAASRKQAEPVAFQIEYSPLGTVVQAFGYTFKVVQS